MELNISNITNRSLELSKRFFRTENTLALYLDMYNITNQEFHKFIKLAFNDKQENFNEFLSCIDFAKSSSDYRRYFNLVSKGFINLNKNNFIQPNEIMNMNMYAKTNLATSISKISNEQNYMKLHSLFMQLITERMTFENDEITKLHKENTNIFDILHNTDICYYSALISFGAELNIIAADNMEKIKEFSNILSKEQSITLLREVETKNCSY